MSGVAAGVIGVAAFLTALAVIARARPVRWLIRTLVGDPVLKAFRHEVAEVVRIEVPFAVAVELAKHPLTNGWGTRTIKAIGEATGADVPPLHHPPEDLPPEQPEE